MALYEDYAGYSVSFQIWQIRIFRASTYAGVVFLKTSRSDSDVWIDLSLYTMIGLLRHMFFLKRVRYCSILRIRQKMQHEEFILTSKKICNSNLSDYWETLKFPS